MKKRKEREFKKFILTLFSLIRIINYFSQPTFDTTYIDKGVKYILKYSYKDGIIDTIKFEKWYKGKCIESVDKKDYYYEYYRRSPYLRVRRGENFEIRYSENTIVIKRIIRDTIIKTRIEKVIMSLYKIRKGKFYCKLYKNYKLKYIHSIYYDFAYPIKFDDHGFPRFELVENEKILYQEGYVKIEFNEKKEIENVYRIGKWLSMEEENGEIKTYVIEYDNKKPESKVIFVEESVNEYITITTIQYVDIKPYKRKYSLDNIIKRDW